MKAEEEKAFLQQVKARKKPNKGKEFKCVSCDMTFTGKASNHKLFSFYKLKANL